MTVEPGTDTFLDTFLLGAGTAAGHQCCHLSTAQLLPAQGHLAAGMPAWAGLHTAY